MAQNLAQKKGQFLAEFVLANRGFAFYRDWLKALAEKWNKDATYSGITQADIDAVASPPPVVNFIPTPPPVANGQAVPVAHLTPTIVANNLTVFQPDLESILAGTQTTPPAALLPEILDALPD